MAKTKWTCGRVARGKIRMVDKVVTPQGFILRVIGLGYKFVVYYIKSNMGFSNG